MTGREKGERFTPIPVSSTPRGASMVLVRWNGCRTHSNARKEIHMLIIVLWIVFSFVVAAGARNRRRSGFMWFLGSLLISPVITGIALLVLGKRE